MSKIRLLLVDDHQIVRAGLRMLFLAESDMDIIGEVGSAEEALELQYGKDFELLGAVEALPGALEALLRRKLLGGDWVCSR